LFDQEQAKVSRFHREGDAVVFDPPEDQKEAARRRRENEQHKFAGQQVKTNKWLAIFSGLLVLATFCTIGIGLWQATISQTAVDVASRTLNETIRSNKAQELSNQRSLDATIDNFHREQRPWVVVKSIDLGFLSENGHPIITITTKIANKGKSPAFDIRITHSGFQSNYGPLNVNAWVTAGKEKDPSHVATSSILAPDDDSTTPGERVPITETQADEIRKHILWIYVFGDIHYTDAFGVAHLTQYCGVYDPLVNSFDICKTHTYIDKNK
jgi:hypothetical protein